MKLSKNPIEFLDELSTEHKKRLKTRTKIGEPLLYMGESVNQKGTGFEFMTIYVFNANAKQPNPELDEPTDLALLQIYEFWRKKYNLRPIQPWDGSKLRPWLNDDDNPLCPATLCGDLSELSRAYSRFEGSDFSNYWSRLDALGHSAELYFNEIRYHKIWAVAKGELSDPKKLFHQEQIVITEEAAHDDSKSELKLMSGGHNHSDKKGKKQNNVASLDMRLYTVTELYNIETALYSVRFWGYLKWIDNLRKKLFNLTVEEFPHDSQSDINFLDNLCLQHFPWHDDVFANGTCPKWDDQFGRKASHKYAPGTQGYGLEFYLFHRELVQTFDNWLVQQGLDPIQEWTSNEHNSAYLLKYAFGGPWGLGGSNGEIIPIEKAAPLLLDENLHLFDSIADAATYIDEPLSDSVHGIGHVQNADLRDPYCNNYSLRFFGWHKWIDSIFKKLEAMGKPLYSTSDSNGKPLTDPLSLVLDTKKYVFAPPAEMPFTGNFVYQSLYHNQNVEEADSEKILWFRAEMNLQQIGDNLVGELDSGNPEYKYSLSGNIDQNNIRIDTKPNWWEERLIIVLEAAGNTPKTKGHLYEYRGFHEPKWPRGKNQIQAFVGTAMKSIRPDDPTQEGYVGSFYSVRREIKRKIFFSDDDFQLSEDCKNIKIMIWGAGGGAGSDGPGEGADNGNDGTDSIIEIHHEGHLQSEFDITTFSFSKTLKHSILQDKFIAGGGKRGEHGVFQLGKGGKGGIAEGGDVTINGQDGENASETLSGKGGDAPHDGGKGGLGVGLHSSGENGFSPAAGGSGGQEGNTPAGGGGSGAYCEIKIPHVHKGTILHIQVGKGGKGGDGGFRKGGDGADGRVIVTWE